MLSLAEQAAKATVIREVPSINRCFVQDNEAENDKSVNLGTEGVNIRGMWEPHINSGLIDLNSLMTNDISAILRIYGVEAARNAIVNEVAGVFGVYGISVDPRHLGLIADYMVKKKKSGDGIGVCCSVSAYSVLSSPFSSSSFLKRRLKVDTRRLIEQA